MKPWLKVNEEREADTGEKITPLFNNPFMADLLKWSNYKPFPNFKEMEK